MAFMAARKGKQLRPEVREFQDSLNARIREMAASLNAGSVRFGPYREFMIHDPKPRLIQVAPFEQRVVHHALMRVVGPLLERSLISDTYACRIGKGQHAAVRRALEFARRNGWYLKLDIEKYYDSIEHTVWKEIVRRRIKDRTVVCILDALIDSYAKTPGRGLPIGNLSSQHLANSYLDAFDHFILERLRPGGYLRYMDDILIFGGSREQLLVIREEVISWLAQRRGLRVKHVGELHRVGNGAPYLGMVIAADGLRLARRSAARYGRRMKSLKRRVRAGIMDELQLQARAQSLHAFARVGAGPGFFRSVEERQHQVWGYA